MILDLAPAVLTVILAFWVGVSLGLLGGGGSVLSVPLLVYVAGWAPHEAATGSLLVVGVTSLIGLTAHARAGRVRWRVGLVFGLAGMAGAYAGGRLAALVPGAVLLVAFAALMLVAGVGMLRGRRGAATGAGHRFHLGPAIGLGALVGTATGFVGAGGGFIVVPALVLVAGLPMPVAVGTSLLVISLQSAAGLAGHLAGTSLPWGLTLAVTASAAAGCLVGGRFVARVHADRLRRGFGVLVLAVAVLVLGEQIPGTVLGPWWPWTAPVLALAVAALAATRLLRTRPDGSPSTTPQETTMTTPSSDPTTAVAATPAPAAAPSAGTPAGSSTAPESAQPSNLVFSQYYVDCLSQASYLIADRSTGQAVIVDPRRDVQEYLDDAKAAGLRIVGVLNTHFHADFLSGHLELAKATGAWIGYGRAAETEFEIRGFADGERFALGDVVLEIMETPGHTPESISVLVYEHADDEVAYGVLTGDALFIGDVGRPDLLASIGFTADELAQKLYDSVQHKLMGLPDPVRVFPAHGAGSSCGKNLSTERRSTIGEQRRFNYACRPMDRDAFITLVTAGQPASPEYFVYDAILNRKRREVYDEARPVEALDLATFDAAVARGAVVLDTRSPAEFATGHLRGAINVPADGRFAETSGMAVTPEDEVVIIAPDDREGEVAMRMARIGFDHVVGYVADPEEFMLAREADVEHASRLTAVQLEEILEEPVADGDPAPFVIDVRNIGEREAGYIEGSVHIPLAQLRRRLDEVPTDRPIVAYCAGGWRSSVAASLLRHHGRADVSDLLGGFGVWSAMREPISA